MRNPFAGNITNSIIALVFLSQSAIGQLIFEEDTKVQNQMTISLPNPRFTGDYSLEKSLKDRKSVRDYTKAPLSLAEVSQLLWAGQGITRSKGYRTAPSAGALYPLELYLVAGNVSDLRPGVYHYRPRHHTLEHIIQGDKRSDLSSAALEQECIYDAAAVIVIAADYKPTTWKYGERGKRYVHMEVGHAAQNISLQATAQGLGIVVVGAFRDKEVKQMLELDASLSPLILMSVGRLSDP